MANKKINQLVLKTTIQSTDLFPLGDATTGQLFKKTIAELQAAIGGAVISVNGLVGTVVLDTDDIQELASPTNRYFTEARARAAISLTTTGSSGASTYSNSTGVLNVPTYTLAGLGGITASFLSGGTGITYNSSTGVIAYSGTVFTDASIRALFSAGTGITYNSSTGAISYSGTVYTDASIRALISLTTSGSSGASTYNNTTGVLNVPTYTLAGLGGIGAGFLSAGTGITYNSSTGVISYSGIVYTDSSVRGLFSATAPITYNSSTGAIAITQASGSTNGFLSSTDWTTFNSKQNAITLTTTGTSGAATFSGGTLNIPQYQAVLTNPVTGTGTTNYVTKWTSSSAIGNSSIIDNGTSVSIGTTNSYYVNNLILSAGAEGGITIANTGTTGAQYLMFADGTTGSDRFRGYMSYNHTDNAMSFATDAAIRLSISSAGTVGIGVTPASQNSGALAGSTEIGGILRIQGGDGRYFTSGDGLEISKISIYSYNRNNNTYNDLKINDTITVKGGGGNVGFGTTTPDQFVSIRKTSVGSETIALALQNIGSSAGTAVSMIFCPHESSATPEPLAKISGIRTAASGALTDLAFFTYGSGGLIEKMRIKSNGDIDFAQSRILSTTASSGYLAFYNNGGGIYFGAIGAGNQMLFTAGGNLLIGTLTDNGERLYVSGSIRATGSITANSDARLKKNIERIENALEKVGQISGYTYNTIYDEDRHAGVIAQEVDKVLPEIVNTGNDGLMGVEYGNISALLIEAIKDLKQRNEKLEAIVEGLSK